MYGQTTFVYHVSMSINQFNENGYGTKLLLELLFASISFNRRSENSLPSLKCDKTKYRKKLK